MNALQLELTRLIGKKELTFGCLIEITDSPVGRNGIFELIDIRDVEFAIIYRVIDKVTGEILSFTNKLAKAINHPATETDLKRWMNEKGINWTQRKDIILDYNIGEIQYDSDKKLIEQETSTLEQIISLIKSNE